MICTSWWIFLLVLILSHLYVSQSVEICYRGYKLYSPNWGGADVCVSCQYEQFMPEEKHSLRQCYQCTKIENPQLEILVHHCNITHDTEIHCIDGYYRTRPSYPHDRGRCQRCMDDCLIPKRPCQKFHDTVCCPGHDFRVLFNKEGRVGCVRECGPGQLLNPDNDQCLPCPQTTYMDESKHVNVYCKNCPISTSPKEKIIRPCNATNPTVIGCVDGYSREFNNIKVTDHTECIKLCGRGEFVERETETCLPYHENTYMDEDRHSHIDKCKPCEVLNSKNDVILQACNRTHPALIGCRDGFYRRLSQDLSTSMCATCRDCSENTDGNIYVGRACGLSENTICCSQPDMDVMDTVGGPVCVLGKTADDSGTKDGSLVMVLISALIILILVLSAIIGLLLIMWRKGYRWRRKTVIKKTAGQCKGNSEHEMSALTATDPVYTYNTDTMNTVRRTSTLERGENVNRSTEASTWSSRATFESGYSDHTDDHDTDLPSTSETAGGGDKVFNRISGKAKSRRFTDSRGKQPARSRPYLHSLGRSQTSVLRPKLDIGLLVSVQVVGSSPSRPECFPGITVPYPFSGKKYRNMKHTGRGQVYSVKICNGQPCTCVSCQRSAVPEKSWGALVISTTTTVVFDLTEGRKTSCCRYVPDPSNDKPLVPSPFQFSGAVEVSSDIDSNESYVTFVTHDITLLKQFF